MDLTRGFKSFHSENIHMKKPSTRQLEIAKIESFSKSNFQKGNVETNDKVERVIIIVTFFTILVLLWKLMA